MKKTLIIYAAAAICVAGSIIGGAEAVACTSLIATPGATTDGSTLATYAADSHTLYGELYHSPAADWPEGSTRVIKEWDTGRILGEIPQVAHTYATMGNMNEHGLTIAESTFGGREELADTESIIDYGSLIYITLERAKTAREAIKVMTDLVKEHGFCSEGESFTIADAQEAWVMEMVGKGKGGKGALWVARRVPDGYIAGHANQSRIHQFPLNDPETLYSPDVITFARDKGWFDGKDEDFSFSNAYCPADYGTLRGCDARVWAYYNKFADGMDRYLPWIYAEDSAEVMPLWVKPSRKLSLNDMKWMMRDHFEGTPFDMTKDVGAGPFTVPYRARPMAWEVDSVKYLHERAIATQQTGFSFVSQMNSDFPEAMRGILWFGCDDANTSVYVPIYSCMTTVPRAFEQGNGDMYTISWDAAFWVNNWVANQAYYRYSQMIPDIRRVQTDIESRLEADADSLRIKVAPLNYAEASAILNDHIQTASADYVKRYKALGDYLLVKYLDFNIKKERDGEFARTPEGMPESPTFGGYDDPRYFRAIVDETGDRLRLK